MTNNATYKFKVEEVKVRTNQHTHLHDTDVRRFVCCVCKRWWSSELVEEANFENNSDTIIHNSYLHQIDDTYYVLVHDKCIQLFELTPEIYL